MARLARVVAVGHRHHVTQRVFFSDADCEAYLALLAGWCGRCGAEVWAYCLVPNHVHLIVVPHTPTGWRGRGW